MALYDFGGNQSSAWDYPNKQVDSGIWDNIQKEEEKNRKRQEFIQALEQQVPASCATKKAGYSPKPVNRVDYVQNWRDLDAEAYAILDKAQQEYASDADRFENFRILSGLSGVPVRQVILLLMSKQLVSIQKGISIRESMKGRYCDVMNYLRLLYAWDSAGEK